DSKGCVFIRAGVSGAVRWVPRVTRSRDVICNQTPTASATATRRAAAPFVVSPPPVVRTSPAAAVVSAPRVIRKVQPAPVRITRRVVQQSAQAFEYVTPPVSVIRGAVNLGGTCAGRSVASNRYTNSGAGVRCGSQGWNPAGAGRVINAQSRYQAPAVTRNTHNYATTTTRRVVIAKVPTRLTHGTRNQTAYQYTWDDGRLNPSRGLRNTAVGRTGAVVQANPTRYTSRPTVSTRNVAPQTTYHAPARSSAGSDHRYVQVGTFGVAANAQRSARRLQNMGLPARIQGAGGHSIVLAGPFTSRNGLQSALNTARRNGFGDAFTRR
ncbi:MAG: SPOR domain-containing protein, partial [Planktomarina sp.]